jgi:hypothetical protein
VASFTPRLLYLQEKSPWYPLDRRLDGPQSRYGQDENNYQPLLGLEPPIIQPVSQRYTIELSRFICSRAIHNHLRTTIILISEQKLMYEETRGKIQDT